MPLALVAAQCERYYGAGWYFAPERWGTDDGYVPFHIGVDAWRTLQSLMAWERLTLSRAVNLAQPRAEEQHAAWQRVMDAEMVLAFPAERAE